MRIKNTPQPVSVIVNVHINLEKPAPETPTPIEKPEEQSPALEAEPKKFGIFNPKIDYSYTVDTKFFNDQIRNTISLSVAAIAGIAIWRSQSCSGIDKFGGVSLILVSLSLLSVNILQIVKALAETVKSKAQNASVFKRTIAPTFLAFLLVGVSWGMFGLWKYGISNANFLTLPDVCKLISTTNQTKPPN